MTPVAAQWVLRTGAALMLVCGLAVAGFGAYIFLDDARTQGEFLDGLGLVVGGVIGGLGLAVSVAAVAVLWLAPSHPGLTGGVVAVFGLGLSLVGVLFTPALLLVGLAMCALGVGAALVAPTGAIHSPGGSSR